MSTATAVIRTDWADRYLGELCAHFSHNRELAVSREADRGVIRFPAGDCVLSATADHLHLDLACRNAASLEKLQNVIDKQLTRCALRDSPTIIWHPTH